MELKPFTFLTEKFTGFTLNRTKLELKRFSCDFESKIGYSLNRTKLELKQSKTKNTKAHKNYFKSHQIGIETLSIYDIITEL